MIYAYALNSDGSYERITSFKSGFDSIMSLYFDHDTGYLWGRCDDTCDNQSVIFTIKVSGQFSIKSVFDAPSTLPNSNNEGFAIAPESECIKGKKNVYWSDDSAIDGHVLRQDNVPCGTF